MIALLVLFVHMEMKGFIPPPPFVLIEMQKQHHMNMNRNSMFTPQLVVQGINLTVGPDLYK